ncbi:condensation domain-containing protein [Micromonospora sp. Llam0]|uniref:condensation domain-containing protein n=1 Tax=Micromonospora sp. Llam0 TaxID=2485143 RepID=UPI000F494E9C|nr:condensation domain-containing protein [Micromonospora sp. Llam0]ROO60627.1 condensation domain-containing protein [Micromonospora sp. Llam0]
MSRRFDAEVVARVPLSWAQHWPWVANFPVTPEYLKLSMEFEIPHGISVETVRRAVVRRLERYEVFRTLFPIGEDGNPVQVIHAGIPLDLIVVRDISEADREDALDAAGFDLSSEFPFRAVISTSDGAPRSLSIVVHHIARDWHASMVLDRKIRDDLVRLGCSREPDPEAGEVWQPRDQALFESSEGGRSRNRRALQHWRQMLRESPRNLASAAGSASHRHETSISSRRTGALSRTVAARESCFPASVLLAAIAVSLANARGRSSCLIAPLLANRIRPDSLESVCTLSSAGWLPIRIGADLKFTDVVRAAQTGLVAAARHGQFASGQYGIERVAAGLCHLADGATTFSFISDDKVDQLGDRPAESVVWTTSGHDGIEVVMGRGNLFVSVSDGSGTLAIEDARTILGGLDKLLTYACDNPEALVGELPGVLPVWRPPSCDWLDHDGAWIRHSEFRNLLLASPSIRDGALFPDRTHGLVVCAAVDPGTRPEDVRDHLAARQAEGRLPVLPGWYLVTARVPEDPGRLDNWRKEGASEGDGIARAEVLATPAEAHLSGTFQRYHHGVRPDLHLSYAENEGRYLAIPAFIRDLESAGIRVTRQQLLTLLPLRLIAAQGALQMTSPRI